MKKIKMAIFAVLFPIVGLFSGCTPDDDPEPEWSGFEKQTIAGVYNKGTTKLFQYTEEDCQYAVSSGSLTSRLQTDAMNKYIHVQFSKSPSTGSETETTITALGIGGLKLEQTVSLYVVKTQNDLIWLWDSESSIGYLLPWN